MTKSSVRNLIEEYSKEYDTSEALSRVDKDLEPARKVIAIFTYNRLEGYKEIQILTDPDLHISYKFYKR